MSKENRSIPEIAWDELNRISEKYTHKRSVKFANNENVSLFPHQVLHKLIVQSGGWHLFEEELKNMNYEQFKERYQYYWDNFKNYPEVDYLVGLYELQSGRCTQLINTRTGKHILSNPQQKEPSEKVN